MCKKFYKRHLFLMGCLILPQCFIHACAAEGRFALIVGISNYGPTVVADPLKGVPYDLINARLMARAMGVDDSAVSELKDADATKVNIEARLAQITKKMQQGDRVFIYFSGHGSRRASASGCEEGFMTYDGDLLVDRELAKYTGPMSQRAEKLITMIDACFSGGVVARSRSTGQAHSLIAKFAKKSTTDLCSLQGVNNFATRSLLSELGRFGIKSENFVQIAAAKRDEVSWDDADKGGVATQAVSRCLLGEAKDLNQSGGVSLDEVRACAQSMMDARMAGHRNTGLLPSTLQITGNRNLIVTPAPIAGLNPIAVPVVIQPPPPAQDPPTQVYSPPAVAPTVPVVAPTAPVVAPPPPPVAVLVSPPPQQPAGITVPGTPNTQPTSVIETALLVGPTGALATMAEIYQQRDPRRTLVVTAPGKTLQIGRDKLSFSVKSPAAGYVYVILLGSDQKSFYLLFPNKIDGDNRIKANQTLRLPRPGWQVTAGGPEGIDKLLVVIAQSPRDPSLFVSDPDSGGGAFSYAVADLAGRQRVVDFFLGKGVKGRSSAISAALMDIREVQ